MKKMNKKQKSIVLIYAILLFIFNIMFFLIPFRKNVPVWLEYVFTWCAFGASLYATFKAFENGKDVRSKLYGYPIFRVGYLCVIAQVVVCVVICSVNAFINVPVWIAAILSILILAFGAIGFIVTDNARDVIEQIEEQTDRATEAVTYFRLNVTSVCGYCKDSELKKKLEKLNEKFQYSDPVSSSELVEIENKIGEAIRKLETFVREGNVQKTEEYIYELDSMLADRNRLCKATKKY